MPQRSPQLLLADIPAPSNPFVSHDHREADLLSVISKTTAFATAIRNRDGNACVLCGINLPEVLDHCHVVNRNDSRTWQRLHDLGWIPPRAKSQRHEPRNGIRLCATHHRAFDNHLFFVRLVPDRSQFVVCNLLRLRHLERFHDRPLTIDPTDRYSPWACLFLAHERVVRAKSLVMDDREISLLPTLPIDDGEPGHGQFIGNGDGGVYCEGKDYNTDDERGDGEPDRSGGGMPPGGREDGDNEKTPRRGDKFSGMQSVNADAPPPQYNRGERILLTPITDGREFCSRKFIESMGMYWDAGDGQSRWAGTAEQNRESWLMSRRQDLIGLGRIP